MRTPSDDQVASAGTGTPDRSSRAWRRADVLSGRPDSIRLSSTTRSSSSSTATSDRVRPDRSVLRTAIWLIGQGGHLSQVGDHQNLRAAAEPGQGDTRRRWRRRHPPRRRPRRTPSPPGRR